MNMEYVSFQQILNDAAVTAGLDPDSGQVTPAYGAMVARAASEATLFAWHAYAWPEVCQAVPDLAWLENGYRLLDVFAEDPSAAWLAEEEPERIPWMLSTRGDVVLQGDTPDTPFYYCQSVAPVFEAGAVVSATNYRTGRVVYDATYGNCWKYTGALFTPGSTLAVDPGGDWVDGDTYVEDDPIFNVGRTFLALSHIAAAISEPGIGAEWESNWTVAPWQPQFLPRFLLNPVLIGIEAWMLRTEGQYTSRERMQRAMESWLADEVINLTHTRRQTSNGGPLARLQG